MAPYPTKDEITAIFKNLETGNIAATFEHVSPDVDWTVMGTHPEFSGHYTSLKEFQEGTVVRLQKIIKEPGIKFMVRNVIGGGEQEWATVELFAKAECKNGLKFDNTYAWCMRFNGNGQIVEVRAYLDVWMVITAIEQNQEALEENK